MPCDALAWVRVARASGSWNELANGRGHADRRDCGRRGRRWRAAGFGASAPRTVHLRGTAYEFNNVHTLLAGASIHVAEFPRAERCRPPGRQLRPRRAGPRQGHAVHRRGRPPHDLPADVHDRRRGSDQRQLPDAVRCRVSGAGGAAARSGRRARRSAYVRDRLDVQHQERARPRLRAVHRLRSTRRGRRHRDASPQLRKPLYFNASVLPDPHPERPRPRMGAWSGPACPAGVYTIAARDPATRFASFVATCRPGRIVNANPPWGLHELASANPARIAAKWSVHGSLITLRSIVARGLPRLSVIRVHCSGIGCGFAARTIKPTASVVDLRRAIGAAAGHWRAGQILDLTVTSHAFNGEQLSWVLRAGVTPAPTVLCIPLGETRPVRRCPG